MGGLAALADGPDDKRLATPHVAGLAALILSQNRGYTNEQVRQAIRQTADTVDGPGFTEAFGY